MCETGTADVHVRMCGPPLRYMPTWTSAVPVCHRSLALQALAPLFLLFLSASYSIALADEDDPRARLEKLELEVQATESEVSKANSTIAERESELNAQKRELDRLVEKERSLGKELEQLTEQRLILEEELERANAEESRVALLWRKRIRAIAIQKSGDIAEHFVLAKLAPDSSYDIPAIFLRRIREADERLMGRLRALRLQVTVAKAEVADATAKHERLRSEAMAHRKVLARQTEAARQALAGLKREQEARENLLVALRAQALRLETVLQSLTSGDDSWRVRLQREDTRRKGKRKITPDGPYNGPGLGALRGALQFPVTGKVLEKFGRHQVRGVKDVVKSKGLEVSAEPDAQVDAVAPGRVAFAGRLPGYGNVVILDHGERSFSLYGRLGEVAVEVGDTLDKGDEIGTVSAADEEGRNFYFEVRQNGAPVNPAHYFSRLPK